MRILAGQFRRPVWHHVEAGRLGRSRGGRQGRQAGSDCGLGYYLQYLYEQGLLGPGKQIDSAPLPMDQMDGLSFRLALLDAIARRAGIGDALAEGCCRAAQKWGRLETDKNSGALRLPAWGATSHWNMPCVEWAYAYMLRAGDPLWHGFMAATGPSRDGTRGPRESEIAWVH